MCMGIYFLWTTEECIELSNNSFNSMGIDFQKVSNFTEFYFSFINELKNFNHSK